jgi:hypothetical protein
MSRISRFVVLGTALASLCGVMSATAGAVTWTNDGATAFTATGGVGTLSSTGVNIACGGADASGTAPASSTAATYLVSGTIGFTSCTAAGSPATIDCAYTLTATAVTQPTVSGTADVTCGLYISGTKLCHIEGAVPGTYTNETGVLTVATSSTGLRLTGGSCPVGSNDLGHLTALTFTIPGSKPTITRAA